MRSAHFLDDIGHRLSQSFPARRHQRGQLSVWIALRIFGIALLIGAEVDVVGLVGRADFGEGQFDNA